MADQRSFAMKTERPFARGGRKEGRKREQRGGKDGEGSGAAPREGGRAETGKSRERGRGEVRTSQIARKDACLSASARSRPAFLDLVLALRLLPSSGPHFANERPTDRPTADDRPWHSATIDEGERAGGGAERGTEDERVELKSTRGISPGHSRSSPSLPPSLPPSLALVLAFDKSPPWICLSLWIPPEGKERASERTEAKGP